MNNWTFRIVLAILFLTAMGMLTAAGAKTTTVLDVVVLKDATCAADYYKSYVDGYLKGSLEGGGTENTKMDPLPLGDESVMYQIKRKKATTLLLAALQANKVIIIREAPDLDAVKDAIRRYQQGEYKETIKKCE